MQVVNIPGEKRDTSVKASELRKEGKIPSVIYGGGDVLEHFTVKMNDIKKLIYTPDFKTGELALDGKTHKCIIKDIQWHPVTDSIDHIDFLALKNGVSVKVEIPVKFKGVSPGVLGGGKLIQSIRRVKVKLDPANLVDELFLDISELELGSAVRVRDIELPEGIELMVNAATPVATVEVPRALKSAEAAAEKEEGAEAAPAEGAEAAAPAEG